MGGVCDGCDATVYWECVEAVAAAGDGFGRTQHAFSQRQGRKREEQNKKKKKN
jgi:hypothetical protein